ncbi:MAG: hypothetical protein SR1Q5_05695 [Quinella sp. 1Q5]|nr:hypothetical protein [Quinella sp. 1Q5]
MTLKLLAPLIMSAVIFLTGCGQEDTPEAALNDIRLALDERDATKLSERVDLNKFFSTTYDATTLELAEHYETYRTKYPDDPYFQHSGEFITTYNTQHKRTHLKFLDDVRNSFFAKMPEPSTPEENPTAYVANEFEKIRQASDVTIKETRINDDEATIILDVQGDNSLRGQLIGQMTFELGFTRDDKNHWHFNKIKNLDELMPALVDKAEVVWITFS